MLNLDLTGKVAVVTGGSGELGRTIVRTLADCGADVAVQYLSNEKNANAAAEHAQRHHRRTLVVQADVTSKSGVLALRDKVSAALGMADIIVNCAVIQYTWTTVLKQAVEDYEGQFRSCVLQNVLMAQAFVPSMAARKWGRVIGINTECSMQCNPDQSAYIAGKRGMDGVLRVLAKEVGEHNITVNQIAPGWTITDKYRGTDQERQPAYEKNVPLRRRGTDQEIANVVAFLASDLASFITGAFIPVSGGTVMPCI